MANTYKEYIEAPTASIAITPSTSTQTIDVKHKKTANVSAMPTGTLGTVTATKGTVTNNQISVTPNVAAGTAGYNAHAAYSGTAVTISASELVSGTTNITTTNATDVTNSQYAQVVDSDLVAGNIKSGVDILGVTGTANTIDTVSSVPSTKTTEVIYNSTDSSYYGWEDDPLTFTANTAGSTIKAPVLFEYSIDNSTWNTWVHTSETYDHPNPYEFDEKKYLELVAWFNKNITSSGSPSNDYENAYVEGEQDPDTIDSLLISDYYWDSKDVQLLSSIELSVISNITLTNAGDKIYVRKGSVSIPESGGFGTFTMTGSIAASGNIMSLVDNTFSTFIIPEDACFQDLFYNCTSLTTAPALPATTLASSCYWNMFYGCTSLTTAPELPATTLASSCYSSMFYGCTSITTAPELPATTLAAYCYSHMFSGCTSITTAPELPATTLAAYCYSHMFSGCTSINVQDTVNKLTTHIDFTSTTASVGLQGIFSGLAITDSILSTVLPNYTLPATTLTDSCYAYMFSGCTSLTTAPALPATTLYSECYSNMFCNCTSLTTAPALPATTLAERCYYMMFENCTSITTAPELPATTLASSCYCGMFYGCTSLTTVPQLPATTLTSSCYWNMFYGCTSLYVSDSSVSGTCEQAWRIPTSGTFTNTYSQSRMFTNCLGTLSSNSMAGASGQSYTYYTQNTPV